MIKLDENWSIKADTYSWVLQQKVTKTRKKKDGLKEEYEAVEKWWYPQIGQCIREYVNETLKEQPSLLSILDKLEKIEKQIQRLPEIYVSDGKLIQIDK